MRKSGISVAITAVAVLAGCSDASKQEFHIPQADLVRVDVETRFGGYSETISRAEAAGYEYKTIVTNCLMRRQSAMHKLFEMSKKAGFDAASAEGHSAVLGFVLRDVGDRFFGECLNMESIAVQQAVRENLLFDLGWDGDYGAKGEEAHSNYPKTFPDPQRL